MSTPNTTTNALQSPKWQKTEFPLLLTVQASSLLRRKKEADGYDAVDIKGTISVLSGSDLDLTKLNWQLVHEHGCLYWKHANSAASMIGTVESAKPGKNQVRVHIYLDMQLRDAEEVLAALIAQEPVAVQFPGDMKADEQGNTIKGIFSVMVLSPAAVEDVSIVQYDSTPAGRQRLAEAAEQAALAEWQ